MNSRISQDPYGNVNFNVNISNTSILPISLYTNGVVNVNGSNASNNKILVIYEQGPSDTPSTATNFFGLGVNTNTLRYQVPSATQSHKFYCGSTISYTISNGSGASGSDIRFKSEVENITNALDKINNMQGKSFLFQENPKRQLGFIANDLLQVIPEVVLKDEDTEEKFLYLQYDRICALHNEGIKELYSEIQSLKNRVSALENN
jgi:hypothetical protein